MRILFLSFPYIPFWGQGRIVRDLAFWLAAKGHGMTLLCLDASGKSPLDFPGRKIELSEGFAKCRAYWRGSKERGGIAIALAFFVLFPRFAYVGIKFIFSLFRIAAGNDVLVGHGQYESALVAFVRMCLPGKRKAIGVIHASIAGYLSAVERFFLFPYFRQLDSIVVLSRAEKAYFVEYGVPQERIKVVPNGIDTEMVPLLAKESMESDVAAFIWNDPYAVCVARLCPQKDQTNLLYAFEKFSRAYPTVKLLFVGTGELEEDLVALAEDLAIREKVRFAGPMENPFPYMAGALFHVLASRYEGFGLVHAEALLLGCPVIASDVPTGPREILSGMPCPPDRFLETPYGVLVPKESSDVLAEAMEYVVTNISKFEQKAHFGSLHVREKYSLANMVEEYEWVIGL